MLLSFRGCVSWYKTTRFCVDVGSCRIGPATSVNRLLTAFILCSQLRCLTNRPILCCSMAELHTKARISPYPNSKQERMKLVDNQVPWKTDFNDYKPPDFTAEKVLVGPVWADPDDKKSPDNFKKIRFNSIDGKTNRQTYEKCKTYEVQDSRPRNPCGRTGLQGRGELGKWGPNHAADPIVTRWKRDDKGNIAKDPASEKPVLQFISILRRDNQEWAIPGGMVDCGEKVSVTLKREFGEEAMNSIEATREEKRKIKVAVDKLFKCGTEVYRGYVDDPRNTDNSWMETIAVNFHDADGTSVAKFKLHAGDDAAGVQWMDINSKNKLYASHQHFLQQVTKNYSAHW